MRIILLQTIIVRQEEGSEYRCKSWGGAWVCLVHLVIILAAPNYVVLIQTFVFG